jgi:hypothetical protein
MLPATANDEERLLAPASVPFPRGMGLVAIWSRRREMADLLTAICRSGGFSSVWHHPRQPGRCAGAVAAIFDGDRFDSVAREELQNWATSISPTRLLTLLNTPRTQDVRAARAVGAEVLAKPFRASDVLWHLTK